MTARRSARGGGSIIEVAPGRWRSTSPPDPLTGRRRTQTHHVQTKRAAIEAHRDFMNRYGRGDYTADDHTLAELLERWHENNEGRLAESTQRHNRERMDRHILPALGHLKLSKVTTYILDRFYNGLTPSTALNCHRQVLSPAFQQARRWGWVTAVPTTDARPKKYAPPRIEPPTLDEIHAFIQTAPQPWMRLYLRVVAVAGLRKSEALALRWTDIDPDRALIHVRGSVADTRATGGVPVVKATKNREERRVEIDPQTVAEIQAHAARAQARAARLGTKVGRYIFAGDPDQLGLHPIHPTTLGDAYRSLAKKAGWPHRLHDFRHAHDTYLLSLGLNPAAVAKRSGHNTRTMLDTYAHSLPTDDHAAATAMALPATT